MYLMRHIVHGELSLDYISNLEKNVKIYIYKFNFLNYLNFDVTL